MTTKFIYDDSAVNDDDFDSEAIETLAYNDNTGELYVEFTSGNEYVYTNVNRSTYNLWKEADSIGRFYQRYISGKYPSNPGTWELEERLVPAQRPVQPIQIPATTSPVWPARSRYSVKWESDSSVMGGNPEYQATDEADALRQFNEEIKRVSDFLGKPTQYKIVSVTHYF